MEQSSAAGRWIQRGSLLDVFWLYIKCCGIYSEAIMLSVIICNCFTCRLSSIVVYCVKMSHIVNCEFPEMIRSSCMKRCQAVWQNKGIFKAKLNDFLPLSHTYAQTHTYGQKCCFVWCTSVSELWHYFKRQVWKTSRENLIHLTI